MWMSQGKEVLCNLKVEIGPWGNVQRTDTVMLMRFEIIVYPAFLLPISMASMETIMEMIPPEQLPEKTINCAYTLDERAVLNKFKKNYITQTTSSARKQIYRSEILPKIFEYWRGIGKPPKDSEESAGRIKVLIFIIYNINRNCYNQRKL